MFSITQRIYGQKNKNVVIVFGGWGMRQWQLWLLGHILASYKFKTIIFTWDNSILTDNAELTLAHFNEIKKDTLKTIKSLPKKESKQLALFGTSQGTVLTLMLANSIPGVNKIILNLSGADLAEVVWSWDKAIRKLKSTSIKQNYTLDRLKEIWAPLRPLDNIQHLKVHQALVYLSVHDEVIPYSQQQQLFEALQDKDIYIEALINTRHRHAISVVVNLLRFPIYINFLKRK